MRFHNQTYSFVGVNSVHTNYDVWCFIEVPWYSNRIISSITVLMVDLCVSGRCSRVIQYADVCCLDTVHLNEISQSI